VSDGAGNGSLASIFVPLSGEKRIVFQAALAVLGVAGIVVGSRLTVPLGIVDASLQSLVVLLIGATYGRTLAVATLLLYLAAGAVGVPVFQGTPERGIGLSYMAGPTGGYLLGYVVAAGLVGWAADHGWSRNPFRLFAVMAGAESIILVLGAVWLAVTVDIDSAFTAGVGPFVLGDFIKVAIVAAVVPASWELIHRLRD